MKTYDVFRDGKVHVMADKCSTCIFRPGNLMGLEPGRVKSLVDETVAQDTVIYCHKTLDANTAVCRGLFDSHKTTMLQLAERLDVIRWQEDKNGDDHKNDG